MYLIERIGFDEDDADEPTEESFTLQSMTEGRPHPLEFDVPEVREPERSFEEDFGKELDEAEAKAQEIDLAVLTDEEIEILFGTSASNDREGLEEWLNEGGAPSERE